MCSDASWKPNFFIVGAPKCGTTTLARWLRDHRNVFMCHPKEPHFFNTDSNHRSTTSAKQYKSYFKGVQSGLHKAVGEASVWYLISDVAVENILRFQPEAKFVVCLRNPIEACVSLHDQKLFSGEETIDNFDNAWEAQQARVEGNVALPPNCRDVREILYGESCKFGKLLEKTYDAAGGAPVHVVLMDDLRENPAGEYANLLDFLGLDHDGRVSFPVANPSKRRYFPALARFSLKISRIKMKLGIKAGTGLAALLNRLNRAERERNELSMETRSMLIDFYEDDVNRLSRLIKRDLSHWKRVKI